jgi:multidrug efflux pump subunit AcrB
MNVSAWCIRNPVAALMFFVMLCFAGVLGYQNMKVQNFPDLDVPSIVISASLPGASPAQLETDVARKLENAIASIQGLKNIYTKVQDGAATITAEFRLEKPTQEALDEVRSAVQQVRADLPSDLRDPVVSKINISGSPVLAYTIRSKSMDDEAMSWFVDDTLSRRLLSVKGVGSVSRVGGVTREVRIALDSSKMQALGVARPRYRASCARCKWKAQAAGQTWAAASNRCARWPRSSPLPSWARWRWLWAMAARYG